MGLEVLCIKMSCLFLLNKASYVITFSCLCVCVCVCVLYQVQCTCPSPIQGSAGGLLLWLQGRSSCSGGHEPVPTITSSPDDTTASASSGVRSYHLHLTVSHFQQLLRPMHNNLAVRRLSHSVDQTDQWQETGRRRSPQVDLTQASPETPHDPRINPFFLEPVTRRATFLWVLFALLPLLISIFPHFASLDSMPSNKLSF